MECSLYYSVRPSFEAALIIHIDFPAHDEAQVVAIIEQGPAKADLISKDQAFLHDVVLDADLVRALKNSIDALTLKAVSESIVGLDGTQHELTIACGFNKVTYSWWEELPTAWSALKPLLGILEQLLQKAAK